jgi:hypothetical protein
VSSVRYELGFYIPEDNLLHSHRSENVISYIFKVEEYSRRACNVKVVILLYGAPKRRVGSDGLHGAVSQ